MALKFKVGDRVRIKEDTGWANAEGCVGTIVFAQDTVRSWPYNVTLDEPPNNAGAENWFLDEDELQLVTDEL